MAFDERSQGDLSSWNGGDLVDLQRFQSRVFGRQSRQADPHRTRWLFLENPYKQPEQPALWIYRKKGEIVAVQGSIRFELKVLEERCLTGWGVDLMTDPLLRDTGIPYDFSRARHESGRQLQVRVACALGLSDDGYRYSLRRGFRHVGTMPVYLWVVDARHVAERLGVSRSSKWAVRMSLRIIASLARHRCRARSKGASLHPIDEFDRRVDDLWSDASSSYSVIPERTLTWLKWRFDQCPHRNEYRRFYLTDEKDVVGYLVLRSVKWKQQPALAVVDYLAAPRYLPTLLACATGVAGDERATVLLCRTLNVQAHPILRKLGFLRRKEGHQLLVRVSDEDPFAQLVRDPRLWFLTAADSDVDN